MIKNLVGNILDYSYRLSEIFKQVFENIWSHCIYHWLKTTLFMSEYFPIVTISFEIWTNCKSSSYLRMCEAAQVLQYWFLTWDPNQRHCCSYENVLHFEICSSLQGWPTMQGDLSHQTTRRKMSLSSQKFGPDIKFCFLGIHIYNCTDILRLDEFSSFMVTWEKVHNNS